MAFQVSMSTETLVAWLKESKGLGLDRYTDDCKKLDKFFKDEGIDGDVFSNMELEDLTILGLSFAAKVKLRAILREVTGPQPVISPAEAVVEEQEIPETPKWVPYCTEAVSVEQTDSQNDVSRPGGAAGAWMQTGKMWGKRDETLKIHFLNPDVLEDDKWMCGEGQMNVDNILAWARRWNNVAFPDIPKFEPTDSAKKAHIRVYFGGSECWSKIGTDARKVDDKTKPTMNLALKSLDPDFQEYLVIHEFGHALGLKHEHQRSDFWEVASKFVDKAKMKGDPRMKTVNFDVDMAVLPPGGQLSKYDPDSVMHYWFDVTWLEDKNHWKLEGVKGDKNLFPKEKEVLEGIHKRNKSFKVDGPSITDMKFVQECYGGASSTGPADPNNTGSKTSGSNGSSGPPARDINSAMDDDDIVTYDRSQFETLKQEEILELVDEETVLDLSDHNAVTNYLDKAAGRWETICRRLNLSEQIGVLKISIGGPADHLADGITHWLKKNYNFGKFGNPTWKKVAESVNGIDNTLFLQIAKDHTKAGVKVVPDSNQPSTPAAQAHGGPTQPAAHGGPIQPAGPRPREPAMGASGVLSVNLHLNPVRAAVSEAANKWADIGRSLPDITEGFIASTKGVDDYDCLRKVLSKWMHTSKATIDDLLSALEDPSVGRNDIARDIRALKGTPDGAKLGL